MNIPVRNGQVVDALYRSIRSGRAIDNIPGLVKQVIQDEMWKSLLVKETGEIVEFSSFCEFVKTAPPEGLGASLDTVKKLCRDDNEAIALIDEATRQGPGKTWDSRTTDNTLYNVQDNPDNPPTGNTKQAGLRRLRKLESEGNQKAATLRKRVLSNELSVNAALIELKLRPKSITLPLDPKKAAATIKRHFSTDDIEALIEELQ